MKYTFTRPFKYWFFVCLLVGGLLSVKGQYVTIPDTAFVSWLNIHGYNTCLTGNQLDTTCNAVVNATSMGCYGVPIKDLKGIKYFRNLTSLDCSSDSLNTIAALPAGLQTLNCRSNKLVTLPPLPIGLHAIYCDQCALTSLSSLPDSLTTISCSHNSITTIPSLPGLLNYFNCTYNLLDSLPALPATLVRLYCNNNIITALPTLPDSLQILICNTNVLTSLPTLPVTIDTLEFDNNHVTALAALPTNLRWLSLVNDSVQILPVLPGNLNYLDCENNGLTNLPALPASLFVLDCGDNHIPALPALPPHLANLTCRANSGLAVLPPLPNTLTFLDCSYDSLSQLPPLPQGLNYVVCDDNYITSLQSIPYGGVFSCENNLLTSLPELPDDVYDLDISYNTGITCLPEIKEIDIFTFLGMSITCLPDYGLVLSALPQLSDYPLCGFFNSSGCGVFWNISGQAYYDANSNCQFDAGDLETPNVKIMLDSAGVLIQQAYGGGEGLYSFQTSYGTYTLQVDTSDLPFTVLCPGNDLIAATISAGDSLTYSNDFALQCRTMGFDLGVQNILNGIPRPNSFLGVNTVAGDMSQLYGAHCASGINGQVSITYTGPINYQGPASGALTPAVNGNTLTYNIVDFGSINNSTVFNNVFQVNSNAIVGTNICFTVLVTPTISDYNPSNNIQTYCFPVVNAIDPNEKEVYPTHVDSANQWLTYTVRFQNTGTAPAINIIVRDTLNPNLDPASFQLLAYSAKNLTQLFGNVVVFNFPNINLADSATSDSLSRGFVQYRVKTISNMQQNAVITNTASIYFDNNSPVVTNTVSDTVAVPGTCTPTDTTINQTICHGDSVLFNGRYYNSEGSYTSTLTNAGGCDSVVSLVLTISPIDTQNISQAICRTDSFYFYGTYLSVAGNYDTLLTSGCYTFVHLSLSVQDSVLVTQLTDSICNGDSLLFNGIYYKRYGNYSAHYNTASGCDSVVNLTLIVLGPGKFLNQYDTICPGDSILFNGSYYKQPGNYSYQFGGVFGCDSLLTMHLVIDSFTFRCYHYPYYPMLDTVNIWHFSDKALFESPPPYNPNGPLLRDACAYPLQRFLYGEEYTGVDTLINAMLYKELWSKDLDFGLNNPCLAGFIREDTMMQKIYFKDILNDSETTLYDYSLRPGDYFIQTKILNSGFTSTNRYMLDSITMVQIAVGTRRKFYFGCDTCNSYQNIAAFSWIEGVGNLADLIFPYTDVAPFPIGEFSCNTSINSDIFPYTSSQILTCFSHAQNVYFNSCSYAWALDGGVIIIDSCTYYLEGGGINSISSLNSFTIYPNPASNQITLQFDISRSDALDISLLDATGRQVLPAIHTGQLAVGTQTRQMNIEGLASGFYLVACKNASGVIYRKLVVRE